MAGEAVAERIGRLASLVAGRLADLVLPPRCPLCRVETAAHRALCAPCWARLPLIERPYCERLGIPFAYDHGLGALSAEAIADPPAFGRARAAARYDGIAVDLVHRLKYGDRVDLAPLLGGLMVRAGADILAEADLLVPVPLHRFRLWRRRFNQAALLAAVVSRRSGVAHDPFLLVRRRRTARQVGLTRRERQENVQGAFAVPADGRQRIAGRRIVLVDDVITTGATAEAAARTLTRAGAEEVHVLAFARVTGEGVA
jgi:ComF family protein